MKDRRMMIGAPVLTMAAAAWLWRLGCRTRIPWYDDPLPANPPEPVRGAGLFEEDCLTVQLLHGDITGAAYRMAMADVAAAQDDGGPEPGPGPVGDGGPG